MKKPKRGRPPKAPDEKREVFALRLSAVERIAMNRAALAAGLSVSEWSRRVLLDAATR